MKSLQQITDLSNAQIRRTPDGRISVFDALKTAGAINPRVTWKRLTDSYSDVVTGCYNFKFSGRGQRETPVTTAEGWRKILTVLPGVLGDSYRTASNELITAFLERPDEIANAAIDRITDPEKAKRTAIRALSVSTNLSLGAAMKDASATERDYPIVHNTNNIGITGMVAKEIQAARGVKNTRDGYTTAELGLLIFAEATQAQRIREEGVQGGPAILKIVKEVLVPVIATRKALIGPVKQPHGGLIQVSS
jgi:hypothetical protein